MLLPLSTPQSSIKFLVDSQAALLALVSWRITSNLVLATIQALNSLPGSVTLGWVPAHVGIPGNEMADELAKAGCNGHAFTPVGIPHQFLRASVDSGVRTQWDDQWTSYPAARQTKQFYASQNKIKAKYVCKLNRNDLGRFVRIVTGHNLLAYHRHNMDQDFDPTCRLCGEERETFYHFATVCPRLHTSRTHAFLDTIVSDDMSWSAQSLIDFSYLPAINELLENSMFLGQVAGADSFSLSSGQPSLDSSLDTSLASLDPDVPSL